MAGQISRLPGSAAGLTGRAAERRMLESLVCAVRAGESRVLVLDGEPGAGKTALLDYLSEQASECLVARVAGVQSEMELAFAGLHQLCAPMLGHLDALPGPQRDALRTAFGISAGPPPDQLLAGLAVLGLLSEVAGLQPLICIVDDQQWLDRASARALGFVARRLAADPVALVFAARVAGEELAGLPGLPVAGLNDEDAGALLDSELTGALDPQVRDLMVAEARGNPLALLELPRGLTAEQLAGGFGLPGEAPLAGGVEESLRRQLDALPHQARRLLQLAAADPSGDPLLVWRAAGRLGIPAQAAEPAVKAGLVQFGMQVRFRHPLVRAAAYRSAPRHDRIQSHAALAAVTDPAADPDRLAWHRAQATAAPDEGVAADLERSARRARARGGLSAAAAFLEHAALLTPDADRQAVRAFRAAKAKHQAGAPDAAAELLAVAEAGPLDELTRARVSLLRGHMGFVSGRSADGPPRLLEAARLFEALDPRLAKETYLDAFSAAMYVGRLAGPVGLPEVARAARGVRTATHRGRAPDLLLDALAVLFTDGYETGAPAVQEAVRAFRDDGQPASALIRWCFVAARGAQDVWDDESWQALAARHVRLVRDAGALPALPLALNERIGVHLHAGELTEAAYLVPELETIKEATGSNLPAYGAMALAGWRGRSQEAFQLIEVTLDDVTSRGEGIGLSLAHYTASVLSNGLGQYEDATASAELASGYPEELGFANLALAELAEAAVRSGHAASAAAAVDRLARTTRSSGTAWGLGIEARARALLSDGDAAERLYRSSIERLSSAAARADLARAHLLYGEWLRRERRRGEARDQLRVAHGMLEAMGMDAFAERAWRELLATSERSRPRAVEAACLHADGASESLTAQEARIARLARDGLTNPEIAIRLFISTRTVQHHLSNVFIKLGVSSRGELHMVLPSDPDAVTAG